MPSLKPWAEIGLAASALGPSPNDFQGLVLKMLSLLTFIQAAMPFTTATSLSSREPSPFKGTLSNRLPFLLTMSISILITVWADLYRF
ncbi:MAG: hypothetical protein BWY72_02401 [Bacteroidetes bacterium ADurb.Bin416]|nr:MAG: hypothetical protein BWY72_02401 [Bacteroidetes bacterium ADurb.Bin416]